jgi:HPt (histidine-containing phosphotransfer) domain-containing protein
LQGDGRFSRTSGANSNVTSNLVDELSPNGYTREGSDPHGVRVKRLSGAPHPWPVGTLTFSASRPVSAILRFPLSFEDAVMGDQSPHECDHLDPRAPAADAAPAVENPGEVLDGADALARLGGDRDLLAGLAAVVLEECPRWVTALRQAIVDRDAATLRRIAHTVKGALMQVGAKVALEEAREMEALGRAEEMAAAAQLCARLEEAVARLLPALAALRQGAAVG